MFDKVDFDRRGVETVERVDQPSEDHLRALKIIRARLMRIDRIANSDPVPVLRRIAQMLGHMGVAAADEPIGANDKTYNPHPLPPLTRGQINALIAESTPPEIPLEPIW